MTIEGLQKLTLLDYPGRTACTVFLGGCNFRCPFCHNFELAAGPCKPVMEEEELLSFLQKRQGLLDGVCFTGGEPLLRRELPALLRRVKELDLAIKLDTNGSFPELLRAVVREGLVDYIAMDIKNAPDRYGETAGCRQMNLDAINESISYLLTDPVDYEFRTTVVKGLHRLEDIEAIGVWIAGAKRYFLQRFQPSEQVPDVHLEAPDEALLRKMLETVKTKIPTAQLRGI